MAHPATAALLVKIVDREDCIDQFLPTLHDLFEASRCGGLITFEKVQVSKYVHGREDEATPA
jgi:PII-like signaling protein